MNGGSGSHDYLQIILSWRLFKITPKEATIAYALRPAAAMRGDLNFTKIARLQIATLRRYCVPDARNA
ncbi:hypothetical protein BK652_05140 [Pseudomonas brassicacearum]|uniref:Uncharacterized protein n=2 Tax=Pseudomonas TaxID=286 RepID=A0A423GFF6_9PSED|nr:hypothetical protein RL74_03980 [Pseudomonas fluorescens]ROM85964.1 hypothetical protein BK652_05140 [Pseudomonas brassicacearum]